MLVTWPYRRRGSFLEAFDPRARLLAALSLMLSTLFFWDVRVLAGLWGLALLYFRLNRLTWRETRRAWLFTGFVAFVFVFITFLTGRGGFEVYQTERLLARLTLPISLFGWTPAIPITVERLFFALSQMCRMGTVITAAILIPYTLDPSQYGVVFRGLGLPDKIAYAMDLAFRFIPTLGRDAMQTMDAQRARGYELENVRGGPIAQIRRLAPLVVPVTLHALMAAEDIIDAMDLRAFGVGRRTWLTELRFRRHDFLLLGLSAALFFGSMAAAALGFGRFWTP
ncbi:MAG: energy-coupling factor transporter transmembrane component T [Thermoflexus sp.]|uniref:energy-coupling factor transporter transmembrane component T family protein n=1 Tax=Thermoflexus TaxID=1495649 RepID=UPI001C782D29|nr:MULTISPECIES: energy-coupling factor transporter transmembrane component T [Thermoflexus]MDT7883824.1 energy-coupling factor transporter transmembrane component T [Thermoflexus sp.]MDT7947335.1 energy-coupling factor transporter transmembrane component T [Thermoflexus sp.]QWK10101.1 MAG: energy-coupling factor transporter transmembrane protein EcfT [Thermoflexus hugenholtzii]